MDIEKYVEDNVLRILNQRVHVPIQLCNKEFWDKPLTGFDMRLSDKDMVYFLLELERFFGISIGEEQLINYGFSTISKAIRNVVLQVEGKDKI